MFNMSLANALGLVLGLALTGLGIDDHAVAGEFDLSAEVKVQLDCAAINQVELTSLFKKVKSDKKRAWFYNDQESKLSNQGVLIRKRLDGDETEVTVKIRPVDPAKALAKFEALNQNPGHVFKCEEDRSESRTQISCSLSKVYRNLPGTKAPLQSIPSLLDEAQVSFIKQVRGIEVPNLGEDLDESTMISIEKWNLNPGVVPSKITVEAWHVDPSAALQLNRPNHSLPDPLPALVRNECLSLEMSIKTVASQSEAMLAALGKFVDQSRIARKKPGQDRDSRHGNKSEFIYEEIKRRQILNRRILKRNQSNSFVE